MLLETHISPVYVSDESFRAKPPLTFGKAKHFSENMTQPETMMMMDPPPLATQTDKSRP